MDNINVVALPVREWVWMAIRETRSRLIESELDHEWLSDDFFKDTVINIIEDALCARTIWSSGPKYLEEFLDTIDWFKTGEEFSDTLYSAIDMVLIPRIYDTIETFIPKEPYHFWILKKINSKDFYIAERGQDYRVAEYYRLKRQYEPDTLDDSMYLANCVVDDGGNIQDLDYALERIKRNHEKKIREEEIKLYDDF